MRPLCEAPFFAGDPVARHLYRLTPAHGHPRQACRYWARYRVIVGEAEAFCCGLHRAALERRLGGPRQQHVRFEALR